MTNLKKKYIYKSFKAFIISILILTNILFHNLKNVENEPYDKILQQYKNQIIYLLNPSSKQCYNYPKTLYFESIYKKYRINKKSEKISTKKVYLEKKDKKYFVLICADFPSNYFNDLFQNNYGIIINNKLNINPNIFLRQYYNETVIKFIEKNFV